MKNACTTQLAVREPSRMAYHSGPRSRLPSVVDMEFFFEEVGEEMTRQYLGEAGGVDKLLCIPGARIAP